MEIYLNRSEIEDILSRKAGDHRYTILPIEKRENTISYGLRQTWFSLKNKNTELVVYIGLQSPHLLLTYNGDNYIIDVKETLELWEHEQKGEMK